MGNLHTLIDHMPSSGFNRHFLLLYAVVLGIEPQKVLEFGAGYSTHCILSALDDLNQGSLLTIDYRPMGATVKVIPVRLAQRLTYLQDRFENLVGEVKKHTYGVCLHDGSHDLPSVLSELKVIIPRMQQDGLILIHDTVAKGDPTTPLSLDQQRVVFTDKVIQGLPGNLAHITLPYGYGLTIMRVRQDFGHGRIKPRWKKS